MRYPLGTFFGVVIIAIITQALVLFNIDPFLVQVVLGGLILWAVGINRWRELRVARQAPSAGPSDMSNALQVLTCQQELSRCQGAERRLDHLPNADPSMPCSAKTEPENQR